MKVEQRVRGTNGAYDEVLAISSSRHYLNPPFPAQRNTLAHFALASLRTEPFATQETTPESFASPGLLQRLCAQLAARPRNEQPASRHALVGCLYGPHDQEQDPREGRSVGCTPPPLHSSCCGYTMLYHVATATVGWPASFTTATSKASRNDAAG